MNNLQPTSHNNHYSNRNSNINSDSDSEEKYQEPTTKVHASSHHHLNGHANLQGSDLHNIDPHLYQHHRDLDMDPQGSQLQHSTKSQSHRNQHSSLSDQSKNSLPSEDNHPSAPQTPTLPRRSERLRYSNGYSQQQQQQHSATGQYEHKNAHPTRRLSASNHSNTGSPTSSTSSGTLSSPTSPSQYSLPYSHSSQRLLEKGQDDIGSTGRTLSSTQTNGRSRTRSKSHPELPNIPLMGVCRSPAFGCSYLMITVFLISFAFLGCIFHSNFYHQVDRKDCQFTYMQPKFYKLLGFDQERTAFAGKYGLLLFRDQYDYRLQIPSNMLTEYANSVYTVDKEAKVQPLGIPALFIPGNAGSAKQMRSIAKEASKYYYENLAEGQRDGKTSARPIDFFTVDFNEEFSALHGHSLLEQAQFLNDAIAYILSLYQDERHSDANLPRPTSVLIVGHSMGGIVARSLFTMSNYRPGSVNTILTAATPHMLPPVTLDFEISNIYNRIESFWTRGFQRPDGPLSNVSLISIAGGNLDIVVNGDSGNIHNIVPQSNGFTVFTSSIPHAWVGSDHLSILWCNQIAAVIGRTLIDVVDARYAQQVKPLDERMAIFRNRLLTGIDDNSAEQTPPKDEEVIAVGEIAHTYVDPEIGLTFPPKGGTAYDLESEAGHLYILPIPFNQDMDTFNLLTDHAFGPDSRLDILLCNDILMSGRTKSGNPTRLNCRYNNLSAIPMPSSTAATATVTPSSSHFIKSKASQEFRFISQSLKDLEDIQYIAILDRGRKMGDPGFLIAQFANEEDTTTTVETSNIGLLNHGLRMHGFPERPTLTSTLRLPNIDNSLLTYTLNVDRQGCHVPERFSPMLRQSSWTMYEDRYAVNIVSKSEGVDINFHGDLPYYERIQLPGKKGIELRFWMDPNCPVPLSLNLQVDRYGSIGKVVIRYRMVVLAFTFLVVVLVLRAQFNSYNHGKPYLPFGVMLSMLIRTTFWKFSLLLAGFAFLQSLLPKSEFLLKDLTRSSSLNPGNAGEEIIQGSAGSGSTVRSGLDQDAYEQMIQARIARSESLFSGIRLEDALLGSNDTFFWFLAPMFFQIAIGIVILIWVILNGLVRSTAAVLTFISKRGSRYVIGKAIGNILSKRSRGVRRRVITTIVLFIMVATFVPYQFAFVVAVLVHIVSCVRSLLVAQTSSSSKSQAAWDRHHFLMSIFVMFFLLLPCTLPVLMVWIRNLSVQWYEPFSSDHRLDYIAPFIFFVEAVTDGAMVPRTPEKGLVVGSANGDLRNLCAKVGTMQAKHGPFDVLFCTGNFFGKETPIETIDELLENQLEFPITTYFMHGDNGVPGIIERTAKRKNGEICNNLFYLGKHGTMTTAESVKIASLSGTFDSAVHDANTEDEEFDKSLLQGHYTKQDILALTQTAKPTSIMDTSKRGVDILLSYEWPAGIDKLAGPTSPPPVDLPLSTFSHPVANIASALQPRYHFAASSGKFWERTPYKNVHGAEHATRFIALGDVGNKNKQRWFYAFNLTPLATVSEDVLKSSITPATTESPLATASELKRRPDQDDPTGFFWDPKRVRNEPPAGYICRRCNQPGHFVKECTAERVQRVPDGYVCNKCNQPGHFIKDCPLLKEENTAREQAREQNGGIDVPPAGYLCKKCSLPGHYIKDCPVLKEENAARAAQGGGDAGRGPDDIPPPDYVCVKCKNPGHYVRNCTQFTPLKDERGGARPPRNKGSKTRELEPCWFCLSNPDVDKNLIVSIGTEVYMAMSKGQLPVTSPAPLVPGGGHVLLIGINHISSFGKGEPEALKDISMELRKYKEGLRKLYESKGAGMVTWELSQSGINQHAHIQIMPIPTEKIDEVEKEFKARISKFFLPSFKKSRRDDRTATERSSNNVDMGEDTNMEEAPREQPTAAWLDRLPAGLKEGFFRVELPGDRVLVCPIPAEQRVDMQFGRIVLADVLDIPERAHWKGCIKTADEERKDSNAFKAAFRSFDFTL
ncbi:GPI inositol deacylase [Linnemannia zychae]|nr:GPI inositol deacylase [Linnemannia zychae]